ncbi:hypothetical protein VPNG_05594 [Cytospora leucostoma]|uniref:Rhomboid family membrane protein n=1 Tax=Cytospora leucostoma TaxID=1230097 RepID=A0A423X6V6_9PEZI|nr:hypothetical protein VPNG_05594 [Cytospora leucostoma]
MATQQTPQPQSPAQPSPSATTPAAAATETPPWLHKSAWGVAILGPIALLMPPRRVGFQSLLLSGGTFWATNLLAYDYTGESITQRFDRRWKSLFDGGLPEKAKRNKELMRIERERREAALPEAERKALQEERERKELAARGPLTKLWMGSEKGDWMAERARKEKEALDKGEGYGTLIIEQIKEVFSGGDKKNGEETKDSKSEGNDKKQ